MRFETLAVRSGGEPDAPSGALAPPIHLSTTFEHPPDSGEIQGYLYQRYASPTQDRLEQALAALDQGAAALVFASGMAAGSSLMQNLPAGSHVLMADDCYFAFRALAAERFARWQLSFDVVDMSDPQAVRAALRPNTRCLWLETPSNPRIKLSPIAELSALARAHGALTVVDATFATPALLNPLTLGADVVLHSTTKYLGGHSDVMGGALIFAQRDALHDAVWTTRKLQGAIASPFASWMILRGLRTLACRIDWHCRHAGALAAHFACHPAIERVHYPGLSTHPQHAIAQREMRGYGGMLSVEVRGGRAAALRVASRLRLFTNATSLGGYESLVEHRQSVEGPDSPTPANLLRLSVGLEAAEDLIEDFDQALA